VPSLTAEFVNPLTNNPTVANMPRSRAT